MAKIKYEAPTKQIPLPRGESMTVRGLGFEDISLLIADHVEEITEIVELWQSSKTDIFSQANLQTFVLTLVRHSPTLVAEVISRGADATDEIETVRKLPFAIQIAAMSEIGNMTMEDLGGLGNLAAVAATVVKGLTDKGESADPTPPAKPLVDSSMESETT